ncbi:MAG: tetratricopeptide repeat protein [Planctomycetales bacterium]|nr:tetratricopeptide repeat protein [Planctomycetales bacterium]
MLTKNRIILLGTAGVGALVLFGALFAFIAGDNGEEMRGQLKTAVKLLDKGRWDLAGRIARDIANSGELDTGEDAYWNYVQGVSAAMSIEGDSDKPKHRGTLLTAASHLEKASELGFPLGYQGPGEFYLGWCKFETYDWDEAPSLLTHAAILWPERRSDALRMAVESDLHKDPADFEAAEASLQTWEGIPGLSESERAKIDLTKARVALAKNEWQETIDCLRKVPSSLPEHPEAQYWLGRTLLSQASAGNLPADQTVKNYETAEQTFRRLILAAETPNSIRRKSSYLVGIALRAQDKRTEALSMFSGVRQRSPESAEAIACSIEEVEIQLSLGNLDDLLGTVRYLIQRLRDKAAYDAQWHSIEELRSRLIEVGRQIRKSGEYRYTLRLADLLGEVFPLSDPVRLQAESLQQWAEDSERANQTRGENSLDVRAQVRDKYLNAAEKFQQLSQLELLSSEYPDILWQAIDCFQKGNQVDKANELLKQYLQYENPTRRPRGFVALAKNYVNAGLWEKATSALDRCLIDFPDHPVNFEARMLAAQAWAEQNEIEKAIEMLSVNLFDSTLSPDSELWQRSLMALSELLYAQGDQLLLENKLAANNPASNTDLIQKLNQCQQDFETAIGRLGEVEARFAESPRRFDAKYLKARANLLAAGMPQKIIEIDKNLPENSRRQLIQQQRQMLKSASEEFRELRTELSGLSEMELVKLDNPDLLRNCYFGEADALYELGSYEEAIEVYRNAGSRYMNQPIALEAMVQIVHCYRALGQDFEAQRALLQAEQILGRIPPELDADFAKLTRSSRQEWQALLTWLQNRS